MCDAVLERRIRLRRLLALVEPPKTIPAKGARPHGTAEPSRGHGSPGQAHTKTKEGGAR